MATELPTMSAHPINIDVVQSTERSRHRMQVDFERNGPQLHVILDRASILRETALHELFWRRLPSVIHLMSRTSPDVSNATANLSDGGDNFADELAFSSDETRALLIPDPGFMTPSVYASFRQLAMDRPGQWQARKDTLLWRGALSGPGHSHTDEMDLDDPTLKQRVRLCLAVRGLADVDVRVVVPERDRSAAHTRHAMQAHGILGAYVPPGHWIDTKFALDIDGPSNSWGNLYTRLLLGCCVLKVQSAANFRQWFYDDFVPWTHFVPVASDLSDIVEKVEWCRSHDQACREIAAAGQDFALKRTPESETVAAVLKINERLGQG